MKSLLPTARFIDAQKEVYSIVEKNNEALGITESSVLYKCDGHTLNGKYFPPKPNCWSERIYEA